MLNLRVFPDTPSSQHSAEESSDNAIRQRRVLPVLQEKAPRFMDEPGNRHNAIGTIKFKADRQIAPESHLKMQSTSSPAESFVGKQQAALLFW